MKTTVVFLTILVLAVATVASCGVSQEDYDALLAEKTSLQSDYDSLATEKDTLTTNLADTEAELADSQNDLQQRETELSQARTEAEQLQTEIDTLTADKTDLESQLEAANAEVKAADLRNFNSEAELLTWRDSIGIIEVSTTYLDAIMEMQRLALEDGFLLSIDLDDTGENWAISLNALTNDRIYAVYPETLDIVYFADITG